MSDEGRKQFCVKCRRRVDLENDIRAVELQGKAGVMCGDDVDKLIAEIYTPSADSVPWQQRPERNAGRKDFWL